ncbi:MAG: efflux RND transporter periplasmic adaptor subunit [bacterium]|nr:efflux RND transporter periplasmic adaptor subunit [bacterium]
MRNFFNFILRNKWWSIFIVIILIVVIFLFKGGTSGGVEFATASNMQLIEEISAVGKVMPDKTVDLSFDKAGTVSKVYVEVGDKVSAGQILASLDSGEVSASLRGAEADVLAEEAKYAELERGTRKEELSVYTSKVSSAETVFANTKRDLLNAMVDANTKSENAIRNKVDVLFDNAESVNPTIDIHTDSTKIETDINASRLKVSEAFNLWKKSLSNSEVNFEIARKTSTESLAIIKRFLDDLWTIINDLNVNNSGLSQIEIDSYRSSLSGALAEFNTAVSVEVGADSLYKNAEAGLTTAKNELSLKQSGSSSEELKTQLARLERARANFLVSKSQYSNTLIIAPFAGVVTAVNPKVGEVYISGKNAVSLMTDTSFKVEVQIPEVDIAKVAMDNTANITLDAYGKNEIFTGKVISIDPAETIFEGVPSYKVTLRFDNSDNRIRSGMTANVSIITNDKNVLAIPLRAVKNIGMDKKVKVQRNGNIEEISIKAGIKGNNGFTEVIEGISEGEKVVVNENK